MLSLVVSTVAFFVFAYLLKRWADGNDMPRGITRSVTIFVVALALAYGVAWLIDVVTGA